MEATGPVFIWDFHISGTLGWRMAELVVRYADSSVPPRVTYNLTPLGADLAGRLDAVSEWLGAHVEEIEAARRRYERTQRQ